MSALRRREFVILVGSAAGAWPLTLRAQQAGTPIVGYVSAGSTDAPLAAAFRKGLNGAGFVEGHNVTVEYHWLGGQFDRLPALMADLVHRRVSVIATPAGNFAAQAAKAATTTIPIVFGVGEDPVTLGLVASLARPGGNLTGINFFASEYNAKRLALLHALVPKAVRVAVLVNPANVPATESTLRDIPEAARAQRPGRLVSRCLIRSNCSLTRSSSESPPVHHASRRHGSRVATRGRGAAA